ncbi:chromosome segregation protein SMC [Planctomicrobium sp. SH661]|uniref:chromosome segregation protein SMC n=1 Tax=Planctomicrobium sp. SH661 TaxID=3448124 RepID=UPI003F5BDE89
MLKSLELFGFKSFADRTLFEFAPGITCVVGPNGSGKSNVVDSIKWILGDQSAKSLRGKEMSDVIFNGSAGRRGSGFAEATLTFDNSNGLFPIDTAEVQIGRRLYQSGDSEYLLNRSPVRLKDIRDVFMGTGAGTAAYSIIEQGRVDQILQSNPTARRAVFEEAAGISKFKARRVEAERRLERVAQNLLRLTDLVDQVESQLNSTRTQASKAAKYREVSVELKAAWTGLAADDSIRLAARLEHQLNELEGIKASQHELQAEIEKVEEERRAAEARIAELDQEVLQRERGLSTSREAIATFEATLRHQSSRRQELDADLQRLRQQRHPLARQVELARAELLATSEQLAAFESRLQVSQQQVAERESQLSALRTAAQEQRNRTEEQRRELSALQKQRHQLGERLVTLQSQAEGVAQNRAQATERLEHLQNELATSLLAHQAKAALLKEAEEALQTRQSLLTEVQQAQWRTVQQREETEQQLRTMRERRSAAEARLAVLEELEQKQEGIAIGVREILRRAATSHYPPWNRILGSVRDLIEVPMDLAPIIDAALGERAQYIAVSDLGPLLDYLNRGAPPIEGRVGFVSITPLQDPATDTGSSEFSAFHANESSIDLTGTPGVYGRADRLVQERERAGGLAARVLSDTWIVETLDRARELIASVPSNVRFVTLQGEVLTSAQQLHVGRMPHETSIVSRKSELKQLKNEIHQLHRNIETATQRLSILSEKHETRTGEVGQLEGELKSLSHAVTEHATQLSGQAREVQRLEKEFADQQGVLEKLDQRAVGIAQESDSVQERLAAAEIAINEIRAAIEADEARILEVQQLLDQTQLDIRTEQMELAQHEERQRGLRQTQTRLTRDQQQRQQQLEDMVQRTAELRRIRSKSDFEVLRAESGIAAVTLKIEQTKSEAREFYVERDRLRAARSRMAKEEEQRYQSRRKILDRQHALEFEIEKQRMQLKTLADRIQEEYQVTLESLVESGVSAYRNFLEERYGTAGEQAVISETADAHPEGDLESDASPLEEPSGEELSQSRNTPLPTFEEVREELEARVDRLRRKLKMMGNVNTDALENLEALETRFSTLSNQLKDLQEAKASLEDIIRRINQESQRIFIETFETIRGHFRELFRKLFGGGDADILLEDPEDVLECGIEIVARPPGKELRSMSLLSGGEKTMTAVGLLFAMFRSKPSPYCILDEVDAALDEANVDRYVTVIKEFVQMTQFVVITHRKRTMTVADVLYGVTMEQAGVSKRISVRFDDVRDNGEIKTAA